MASVPMISVGRAARLSARMPKNKKNRPSQKDRKRSTVVEGKSFSSMAWILFNVRWITKPVPSPIVNS